MTLRDVPEGMQPKSTLGRAHAAGGARPAALRGRGRRPRRFTLPGNDRCVTTIDTFDGLHVVVTSAVEDAASAPVPEGGETPKPRIWATVAGERRRRRDRRGEGRGREGRRGPRAVGLRAAGVARGRPAPAHDATWSSPSRRRRSARRPPRRPRRAKHRPRPRPTKRSPRDEPQPPAEPPTARPSRPRATAASAPARAASAPRAPARRPPACRAARR